ncbi:50S ribosomal protein L35ae [Candidatus Woesearchaeota archaeon]|nr:50S ribosomal protein L35ae [Candidatus Woesearchaeota archaeon]
MEVTIMHFRQGMHRQNTGQAILKVADTAEEAEKFIGKKVTWTSPGKNKVQIVGKISALHGRNGNVRSIFSEKGLPGQALGQKIKVE